MNSFPPFHAALTGFITFLQSQGAPTDLLFVDAEDVALTGRFLSIRRSTARNERREHASQRYEAAVKIGLGVEIAGIATAGKRLVCLVYHPLDQREAEERMIPRDIKYSLGTPLLEARFSGRILWCFISWRARRDPWLQEWKRTTFGHAG